MSIDFRTDPSRYRHWQLDIEGRIAYLRLDVDEKGGLVPGYELKLNSYDLGVDIELYDAVQRLRFEHPEVGAVVITSAHDRNFCAGANIRMLSQSTHAHKVNFCKFTNETRNSIEDASNASQQTYLCALNGTAAGGGYELALATSHIMLVDDGSSAVSLPELPLLAVLPGTGGLTRLVDKRWVRRDHADFFCTVEEGIRGKRALRWRLVDELVPRTQFWEHVGDKAVACAAESDRPADGQGVHFSELEREVGEASVQYRYLKAEIDRDRRCVDIVISGPDAAPPADPDALVALGDDYWGLRLVRELDDLILHFRHNELEIGTWVFHTHGDVAEVLAHDEFWHAHQDHWLVRELVLFWKRTLKRLDVTSRSLVTLVEPGSCFAGTLLELALCADRSFMLDGEFEDSPSAPPTVALSEMNFGPFPMVNGITRLEARYLEAPERAAAAKQHLRDPLEADAAESLRLVTFIPDDIDWEDEVRIAVEERAAFSPDALTGMEASLRFAGPETMESKIFSRLSAWQNWIFQRPNAVGETGALKLYGTGARSEFDKERV
ncbi:MAG: 2,3-epoxybenzoyl-CoA dihydrolase [Gammaproteobacteria bacterium]|nr:2,3-epoxybenzoyl-CoA dihydrolase [Gammaproteobacteria bacterium]